MTQIEQLVIGSILLTQGQALNNLTLQAADFDNTSNERIYKVMLEMKQAGQPIDIITVGAALPKLASYLHDTVTATQTPAAVAFYANKVMEEATRRRLAQAGTMIYSKAQHEDLATVFDTAKREIDDLIDRNLAVKATFVADELVPYMDVINTPKNYPESPWPLLNEIIGGFRPGGLYIIGARPGVGKTIVGQQIAWQLSKTGPVSFHSLEMGRYELYNRIIASESGVYLESIEKGNMQEWEWDRIVAKRVEMQSHMLAIHDKSGQTLVQIRALANSVKTNGELKAIVIDYLGLIQDTERTRKRYERITDISIGLKNLARDLNVPVIALAQLNRGPEQRKDSKPDMADLRDSGGIEQDADVVILLHREQTDADKLEWQKSQMIMKVAKNRHGALGEAWLKFQGHIARVDS